ncbi:MAG TPA: PASTA domain-containing protein [Longimicrobiales bacterium]|nr:PASTA domain-containing protein [Longimicrobiales bacterium]
MARLVGVSVAGGLLGYLVATRLFFPAAPPPPDLLEVPDLRGQQLAAAAARAESAGLALGQVEYLTHPRADSGAVMGQSPLAGQLAFPGDSLRVTLSLGPERRAVPAVSGLRGDRAVALLRATGFSVQVDSMESAEPRGRVLRVSPAEGEALTLPGEVALRVSLGPPTVPMPDLLGMQEEAARDSLNILGLTVSEVEEVFRFGRDQGRVVSQDPPAGEQMERGSAVRLVVGRRGGSDQDR